MIKISDIVAHLETIAPVALAEDWDPIGLQLGDPDAAVRHVLLCLDLTPAALAKARAMGAELIITHHPLLFSPLPTIRTDRPQQKMVIDLIRHQIAVYSAHTNLDAAAGGVADALAQTFEAISGPWEPVLPIVLPEDKTGHAIHGHGRYCDLDQPIRLSDLRKTILEKLSGPGCRINSDQNPIVSRLAVFPGSFDDQWIERLNSLDIDTVVTGECKHHIALMLAQNGIALLDAGHDISERVVLKPLSERLAKKFDQLTFAVDTGLDYNKVAF